MTAIMRQLQLWPCASIPPLEGDQRLSLSRSSVPMPAACVKRLAKHAIAFTRSDVPMFLSLTESNMMLSWRGNTAGARIVGSDFGKLLILLLLDDSGIATGASPETALDE